MKKIYLFLLLSVSIIANDAVHTYASSEECKACHTQIYDEFYNSMHANSTPDKDPIHNAVWQKHPQNIKQNRYGCGKCHTPAADNLDKMMTLGQKAMPDVSNKTHQEAISCAYCHRIKSIELHKKTNTNIMTNTPKNYFGTLENSIDSPYHMIVSSDNKHIKNGNVCIGCHSHKMNKHGLNVCSTNIDNNLNGANCVSCHMPKVKGSVSMLNDTKVHSFHGFPGSHFNSEMLTKYVDLSILRNIDSFTVNIDNRTSHALLLHPLRVAVLKVNVTRGSEVTTMKNEIFMRIIGKDGKPAMPWAADKVIKDTMIQANEKRGVKYDYNIQIGDKIDVTLGWFLVNPKVVKKLGLQNEEIATKFIEFKKQSFVF